MTVGFKVQAALIRGLFVLRLKSTDCADTPKDLQVHSLIDLPKSLPLSAQKYFYVCTLTVILMQIYIEPRLQACS